MVLGKWWQRRDDTKLELTNFYLFQTKRKKNMDYKINIYLKEKALLEDQTISITIFLIYNLMDYVLV